MNLETRLAHRVVHRLPDFEMHYKLGAPDILSFSAKDCRDWHREFVAKVIAALGRGIYLPVFRVSHGEFIMAVGYQCPISASLRSRIIHHGVKVLRKIGVMPTFCSGSLDNTHETYSRREFGTARRIYVRCLREISKKGLLCIALNENRGFIEYIPKYLRWLETNEILLHEGNYFPFYSIYALLLGPDSETLIQGRRLLVITSFSAEKEKAVEQNLYRKGASSVQCYPISPDKSIFDRVDLDSVRSPIDLVLIGAGVGACNILEQVETLGAVAIDAGFAIDVIAFPEKRWNRPYCVADHDFDLRKIKFLEQADIGMLKELNAAKNRSSELLDAKEALIRRQIHY